VTLEVVVVTIVVVDSFVEGVDLGKVAVVGEAVIAGNHPREVVDDRMEEEVERMWGAVVVVVKEGEAIGTVVRMILPFNALRI
jgi:hypothetical protein